MILSLHRGNQTSKPHIYQVHPGAYFDIPTLPRGKLEMYRVCPGLHKVILGFWVWQTKYTPGQTLTYQLYPGAYFDTPTLPRGKLWYTNLHIKHTPGQTLTYKLCPGANLKCTMYAPGYTNLYLVFGSQGSNIPRGKLWHTNFTPGHTLTYQLCPGANFDILSIPTLPRCMPEYITQYFTKLYQIESF